MFKRTLRERYEDELRDLTPPSDATDHLFARSDYRDYNARPEDIKKSDEQSENRSTFRRTKYRSNYWY